MKYLEQIEAYLNNTLSEIDRADFENECATNEALAQEFAFYLQAQKAIKQAKIADLNQRYKTSNIGNSQKYRYFIIAIISAILIGVMIWLKPSSTNDKKPVATLAQKTTPIFFSNSMTSRSDDTSINIIYETALQYAKDGKYGEVIKELDTLTIPESLGLRGFVYFKLGEYSKSITNYEAFLNTDRISFERLRAQWNLSLAYRSIGDNESEVRILEKMGKRGQEDINTQLELKLEGN